MNGTRLKSFATALFFFAYLIVQAGYPALSWFDPRFHWFAWNMYTGRTDSLRFFVVRDDGSTWRLPRFARRDAPVRVYSAAVDKRRFVPPHVCARWPDVREVRVRSRMTARELVFPCRSTAP